MPGNQRAVLAAQPPLTARPLLWLADAQRSITAAALAILGPRAAYAVGELLARAVYRLADPIRTRSEAQCRAALAPHAPAADLGRIAEAAFVHRVWNLVDLYLAGRWLHPGTFRRYGGEIPVALREALLAGQRRGQPILLLTAYFGAFDLLPLFLGYNGIRVTAVYRPHVNRRFDALRQRVRTRSGTEMVAVSEAPGRIERVLSQGGTVALLWDRHRPARGVEATFLGLPTRAGREVGVLACRHAADVVVAGLRRAGRRFRFEFVVADVVRHQEFVHRPDGVEWVTRRCLVALERLVLTDPTQYLWAYTRWGTGDG